MNYYSTTAKIISYENIQMVLFNLPISFILYLIDSILRVTTLKQAFSFVHVTRVLSDTSESNCKGYSLHRC